MSVACLELTACGFRLPGAEDQDDELSGSGGNFSEENDAEPILSHPVPARTSAFARVGCPFQKPKTHEVECGYVSVPERHADPQSRTIQVAVAIAYANEAEVAAEPAVVIQGGPGAAAIEPFTAKNFVFSPLLADRDVVVIDPRGVGLSRPALTCPDVARLGTGDVAALLQATASCHAQLMARNIALDAVTISESVADINAVRLALGYRSWHVYGVSYGTRLALALARDYPSTLSSLVLDSIVPPQIDFVGDTPNSAAQAFEHLFETCAEQPSCRQKYGDIRNKLQIAVRNYDLAAATTTSTGSSGREFLRNLRQTLYRVSGVVSAPELIEKAYADSQQGLRSTASAALPSAGTGSDFAWGVYFSLLCGAELPFTSREMVEQKVSQLDPLYRPIADTELFDLCAIWAVPTASTEESQPISSAVPSLLLSGAFDPITSPAFGAEVGKTLLNRFEYTLADQSHGAVVSSCGFRLMTSFLRAPGARPDDACVSALRAPLLGG